MNDQLDMQRGRVGQASLRVEMAAKRLLALAARTSDPAELERMGVALEAVAASLEELTPP